MDADERRTLAQHARRVAGLMHQPNVKKELLDQAQLLESEADELGNATSVASRNSAP